jgi:agmatine deiminase
MPAEWAKHEGTVLTWPHREEVWRGAHADVEQAFADIAAHLARVEDVHINVPNAAWRDRAARLIAARAFAGDRLFFHEVDSDDVWARDHGPSVVFDLTAPAESCRVMVDWVFNAWGGKFGHGLDNLVVRKLNDAWFNWPRVEPNLVMEGGAFEVNGVGDLLTTEAVLLNANRNPSLTREQIEARLKEFLGVDRILWLSRGLLGDDTDGHIDDIARFVDEHTIVAVLPESADHPDYDALAENVERLRTFVARDGEPFRIVTLPSPEPVYYAGEHLPASHANFYIANNLVLVPIFDQPSDVVALATLRAVFPGRDVVGVDCRAIVSQYGAIHCITQQIPAVDALG